VRKRRFVACCALAAAATLTAAQAAESPVTLDASPRVSGGIGTSGGEPVGLRGRVARGANGDIVKITARQCGLGVFQLLFETHLERDGTFSGHVGALVKTDYRAEWKGQFSAPVTVQARPSVRLNQVARRRFRVEVVALRYFRQASVQLQRYTGSRWVTIKRARLVRSFPAGQVLWTVGHVVAVVGKGTNLRAVLPRSQSGACYIAGVSNVLRASG
jgi:hypothetical protein